MTMTGADLTIRKQLMLECSREHAFAVFTDGIGEWWPMETHSIGGTTATPRFKEGKLVEVLGDGSECHWANVVEFDPPHRIVLEWKVNPDAPAATDVEVTFTELEGKTRVELVHTGWEKLGPATDESRSGYHDGWDTVLGRYAAAA
jgi:uncharacterized protein YndB with AHSA1/START domain